MSKKTYLAELGERLASEQLLEHPELPQLSLSPDVPAVAAVLNKMRQRSEMEMCLADLESAIPAKQATSQQLRSRIVEAERLIAVAKADLLAGRQPDPNAALQSLIIDDLRQQLIEAQDEQQRAESEISRVRGELSAANAVIDRAMTEYANDVRISRAYALQKALIEELTSLADADGGRGQYGRKFSVSTSLAAIVNSHGFIEILRTRRGMVS